MPRRKRSSVDDINKAIDRQNKQFKRQTRRLERQRREDIQRAKREEKRRNAQRRKKEIETRKRRATEERKGKQGIKDFQEQRGEAAKLARRNHLENVQFRFQDLSPSDFEEFVAILFQKMGYQTIVRGGTGDEGVDVEARRENEFLVIQCKKYGINNKVGSPDIQRFYGAIKANRANRGVLVTTSSFTKPAKQYASRKEIDLVNYAQLDKWAKTYQVGPYSIANKEKVVITSSNVSGSAYETTPQTLKLWHCFFIFSFVTLVFFMCSFATLAGVGTILSSIVGRF